MCLLASTLIRPSHQSILLILISDKRWLWFRAFSVCRAMQLPEYLLIARGAVKRLAFFACGSQQRGAKEEGGADRGIEAAGASSRRLPKCILVCGSSHNQIQEKR